MDRHTPRPLQVYSRRVPCVHVAAPQAVVASQKAHVPAPLQLPEVPQVDCVWAAHSLSGSVPEVMGPQMPSGPAPLRALLQAMHVLAQAVSQQKPSRQLPLRQLASAVQARPLAFFATQVLALQK